MAENSKIEWTDHTFNPWIGCTKVSPGCAHCYAETLNKRMKWVEWGPGGQRKRTSNSNWEQPIKWNREARDSGVRRRVFCASLADWLDPVVPDHWRTDLLQLIADTPSLDWLLLTKRPEEWIPAVTRIMDQSEIASRWFHNDPPPNVWIGTSAESQYRWDMRLPNLMSIPADVRFVSAEPLLGLIDMSDYKPDWVIVGGESGPGARPMSKDWATSIRDQCFGRRIPFFFKQWGGVNKKATGRRLDGRTWSEMPAVGAVLNEGI